MKSKTFITVFLVVLLGGLLSVSAINLVVDPYFHYHGPMAGVSYKLDDERYQNDGITKHFKYDAIITGTSMTENFKTSELDALFGTKSIKVCFMGGSYKEISDNIRTGLEYNQTVRMVVRATDLYDIICDPDMHPGNDEDSSFEYPWYLYDRNPFNDVEYVLNKSVLSKSVKSIISSIKGVPSTTFDEYMRWEDDYSWGKEAIFKDFNRADIAGDNRHITDAEKQLLKANIQQNVIDLANDYPEVTFYIWIPPYSVCYYDTQNRRGELLRDLEALETEIEMLVEVPNIKLFCFSDRTDIVTALSLYRDVAHYNSQVNSEVLRCMAEGRGLLSGDNYKEYLAGVYDFYLNYDYDSIYE